MGKRAAVQGRPFALERAYAANTHRPPQDISACVCFPHIWSAGFNEVATLHLILGTTPSHVPIHTSHTDTIAVAKRLLACVFRRDVRSGVLIGEMERGDLIDHDRVSLNAQLINIAKHSKSINALS